ncbi:hypothetical protein HOF65_06380 [bacterium]|nr:hypothetical protein [bacterium]MBT4632539.1 hypothetical protein [bacterium]MBT6779047.1 hypothetical protein [bacterium]
MFSTKLLIKIHDHQKSKLEKFLKLLFKKLILLVFSDLKLFHQKSNSFDFKIEKFKSLEILVFPSSKKLIS